MGTSLGDYVIPVKYHLVKNLSLQLQYITRVLWADGIIFLQDPKVLRKHLFPSTLPLCRFYLFVSCIKKLRDLNYLGDFIIKVLLNSNIEKGEMQAPYHPFLPNLPVTAQCVTEEGRFNKILV